MINPKNPPTSPPPTKKRNHHAELQGLQGQWAMEICDCKDSPGNEGIQEMACLQAVRPVQRSNFFENQIKVLFVPRLGGSKTLKAFAIRKRKSHNLQPGKRRALVR